MTITAEMIDNDWISDQAERYQHAQLPNPSAADAAHAATIDAYYDLRDTRPDIADQWDADARELAGFPPLPIVTNAT